MTGRLPLDGGLPLAPELLVQPLLGLPGIAVERPPVYHLHHGAPLLQTNKQSHQEPITPPARHLTASTDKTSGP